MAGRLLRRARLLPLGGFLLLALAGCLDRELATAPAPDRPAFYFSMDGPVVNDAGDDGDGICDPVHCTLREAVEAAQDRQTITFAAGLASPIQLDTDQPQIYIDKNLAIVGPGAELLTVDAGQTTPNLWYGSVFRVNAVSVLISGLTITGGYGSEGGGVYVNGGELLLNRSVITGNAAYDLGGGIFSNAGTVTISESTISNNTAGYSGGGIDAMWSGSLTIERSTISGNRSGNEGGGIANEWGVAMLIDRSTISGNSALYEGGGIMCNGPGGAIVNSTISGNTAGEGGGGGVKAVNCGVRISHSTITGNQATWGGGVATLVNNDGNIGVRNSIIQGNGNGTSADDVASEDEVASNFVSYGYNLVGTGGAASAFAATGDQVGVDALLGPLQLNEPGVTDTHALLTGSPAINAGTCTDHNDAVVATDQRGVARPQGGLCDIGAYEVEGVAPPPPPEPEFTCTFKRNAKNGQLNVKVTWEYANPGVTRIQVVDGRTLTKQQAPSASGAWSTSIKSSASVLTYGVWGGVSRKDASYEWVPTGTSCSLVN